MLFFNTFANVIIIFTTYTNIFTHIGVFWLREHFNLERHLTFFMKSVLNIDIRLLKNCPSGKTDSALHPINICFYVSRC